MPDLLEVLDDAQRHTVLSRGRRRTWRRRDFIMHEGDPADSVQLIVRGYLGIRVTTPRGEEATIGVRGAGEVIGEMALVGSGEERRSASVVALSDAETLAIHRRLFDEMRRDIPAVSEWLVDVLADRLRGASAHLRDALFESADVRVLRHLLEASRSFDTVEVPLSQQDLATMAGTTRPTTNRTLREMEGRGHLVLQRGRVRLVDVEALRRRAGLRDDDWST